MKEIKFRALTYEGALLYNIGTIEFFEGPTYTIDGEVPSDLLMQYSGYKDCDNNDLYKDDIIQNYYCLEHRIVPNGKPMIIQNGIHTISHDDYVVTVDGWYVTEDPEDNYAEQCTMASLEKSLWEDESRLCAKRLGNIHENPDMLEQEVK